MERYIASRLRRLPAATVLAHEVRVATRPRARLLGLAYLDRAEVGGGLLIPRCSSVHTFGMRFPLDLLFLSAGGEIASVRRALPSRSFAFCRGADAVLEIPGGQGGEFFSPQA
jgi:uncharacterized membrane protein (UPF0127 family)